MSDYEPTVDRISVPGFECEACGADMEPEVVHDCPVTGGPVLFSIMPMNSTKDYKARAVDVAQPLMAAGPAGGNQGGDYLVEAVQEAVREVAAPLTAGGHPGSNAPGRHKEDDSNLVAFSGQPGSETFDTEVAAPIDARERNGARSNQGGTLVVGKPFTVQPEHGSAATATAHEAEVATGIEALEKGGDRGVKIVEQEAFRKSQRAHHAADAETWVDDGVSNTLNPYDHGGGEARAVEAVVPRAVLDVRRLTPTECERLQGFDDGWTESGDLRCRQGGLLPRHDALQDARQRRVGHGRSVALRADQHRRGQGAGDRLAAAAPVPPSDMGTGGARDRRDGEDARGRGARRVAGGRVVRPDIPEGRRQDAVAHGRRRAGTRRPCGRRRGGGTHGGSPSPRLLGRVLMALGPAERSERARKAARAMHAKHDGTEVTEPARKAFMGRFGSEEEKSRYFRDLAARSRRNGKKKR